MHKLQKTKQCHQKRPFSFIIYRLGLGKISQIPRWIFKMFINNATCIFTIQMDIQDSSKSLFTQTTRRKPYSHVHAKHLYIKECLLIFAMHLLAIFQRFMMVILSNFVEHIIKVFMDDFFVYGITFGNCLTNLSKVLQRYEEVNLILNQEKCHFIVRERDFVRAHNLQTRDKSRPSQSGNHQKVTITNKRKGNHFSNT